MERVRLFRHCCHFTHASSVSKTDQKLLCGTLPYFCACYNGVYRNHSKGEDKYEVWKDFRGSRGALKPTFIHLAGSHQGLTIISILCRKNSGRSQVWSQFSKLPPLQFPDEPYYTNSIFVQQALSSSPTKELVSAKKIHPQVYVFLSLMTQNTCPLIHVWMQLGMEDGDQIDAFLEQVRANPFPSPIFI